MIIKDSELLGNYIIKVKSKKWCIYEIVEEAENHHVDLDSISAAIGYIWERRMLAMDKEVTLKEFFDMQNTFDKELKSISKSA